MAGARRDAPTSSNTFSHLLGLPAPAPLPIADGGRAREPTRELVFLGAWSTARGWLFCTRSTYSRRRGAARHLRDLPRRPQQPAAPVEVRRRAEGWPWQSKVLSESSTKTARLCACPGRLVLRRHWLTLPNVTYELLGMGTTMVASRAGGIEELIDPRDLSAATFDPFDPVATVIDAADTARRIPAPNRTPRRRAARSDATRCAPARSRSNPRSTANDRALHERVAGARLAPASIELAADELPARSCACRRPKPKR